MSQSKGADDDGASAENQRARLTLRLEPSPRARRKARRDSAKAEPVEQPKPVRGPSPGDIVLVPVVDHFSMLRSTGDGLAAYRHPDDPRDALPRLSAMAAARDLAFTRRMSVWAMSAGTLTFVVGYRPGGPVATGAGVRRASAGREGDDGELG